MKMTYADGPHVGETTEAPDTVNGIARPSANGYWGGKGTATFWYDADRETQSFHLVRVSINGRDIADIEPYRRDA